MSEIDYTKEPKTDKAECTTVYAKRKSPGRPKNGPYVPTTHAGHKILFKQAKFLDAVIELGDVKQAAKLSGYSTIGANQLLAKDWIKEEIQYRMALIESEKIANAQEIMQYLTRVMRGEEKDQFGLDVAISERTRAAQELARRVIDIPGEKEEKEKESTQVRLVISRQKPAVVVDGEYKEVAVDDAEA